MVFICRENPRRSGISLFPDCPRFYRYTGKTPVVLMQILWTFGMWDWSQAIKKKLEDWKAKTIAGVPSSEYFSFHMSGMIADHRRNPRRVGKIEKLPTFPI